MDSTTAICVLIALVVAAGGIGFMVLSARIDAVEAALPKRRVSKRTRSDVEGAS